jgi:hypothetical protein
LVQRIYPSLAAALVLALVALALCAPLVGAVGRDWDADGIPNGPDNCLKEANPDQRDMDGDGEGDVCDSDRDGDGQLNASDPCPDDATNACVFPPPPPPPDADGDGVSDAEDQCPNEAGPASNAGCPVEEPPPPPPGDADVMAADDFVGRIGVQVHFTFPWTLYDDNYQALTQMMKDAHIGFVRDHISYEPGTTGDAEKYAIFRYLAANGIKATCIVDDRWVGQYPMTATKINYINTQSDNVCAYFEGQNEPDLRGGWTTSMIVDYQRQIFDAVNGSSRPGVPVAGPSVAQKTAAWTIGTSFDAYTDKGNMHPYFWSHPPMMETRDMRARLDASQAMTPGKPLIASEFGYATDLAGSVNMVSKNVQSKYMLRQLLWGAFEADFERLIIYEFMDEPHMGSGDEANFGIVHADLTPKPAYTSLKRLNALLAEPNAPSFTPQPLGYTLSGAPADVKAHVFQKSNGTHYLVMYRNLWSWDPDTRTEITNPSAPVTVNLSSPASRVVVHSPHTSATPISSTAGPLSSVNVSVPDHPVVVEVLH